MDIMDNIINQMIDFESEIHIQVDVEEKNAEGKTGKYFEKANICFAKEKINWEGNRAKLIGEGKF